ncbi:MAG TPA: TatD family deoxyribonuclease [Candidatus Bathyarchaeota archaeon]|nr:TatD family deoxyribonuclease [Candidatus Bathyarchaeota archaeon]
MLVDTHSHLEMSEFDKDREEVIERAFKNGVGAIIAVGITPEDSKAAVALAEKHGAVYATVGVHPHDAERIKETTYESLKKLAAHKKVVAWGEIGLDFFRNRSPRDVQIRRFEEQLSLARELNLPVVIHSREAHAETFEILEKQKGNIKGVLHCFSGDYRMAAKYIDLGYYISIPGTITFPNSAKLVEVAAKIPMDSLLIETDAPFLTPVPKRGKRNEPAYVAYVAKKISDIRGLSLEKVAEATTENAINLFGISIKDMR